MSTQLPHLLCALRHTRQAEVLLQMDRADDAFHQLHAALFAAKGDYALYRRMIVAHQIPAFDTEWVAEVQRKRELDEDYGFPL